MRRLQRFAARCCLGALLIGQVTQARTYDVMVIVPSVGNVNNDYGHNENQANALRTAMAVIRVLNQSGANYGTIESNKCRTEWIRTGVFGRGTVTSGVAESADTGRCVIFPSFATGTIANVMRVRVDSVMRSARGGPLVPQLFITDNAGAGGVIWANAGWMDDGGVSLACSTGVVGANLGAGPGGAYWPYLKSDPTLRWRMFSYEAAFERNPNATPAGGLRVIVGGATTNFIDSSISQGGLNCQFPQGSHTLDDAGVSLGKDSMYVWDRLWGNITGAKTQTFVSSAGHGWLVSDSLSNAAYPDASNGGGLGEFGFDMMLAGLCHFDSLTLANSGRRLIFGNMSQPRKLALTIDGGLCRSLRYYGYRPGIDPRDTTSFYSTLDSLRLAGIPATIGINVDSAGQYQRDIIKLAGYSQARFCPEVWTGILDTATVNTAARFRDVFGRWNNRTFVGDGSGVGKDSSVTSKLTQARSVCDSLFPGRTSRFLLVPDDDYSPKQMRTSQQSTAGGYAYSDSLLYAINRAGFRGLRVDGRYTDADPNRSGGNTNPRGWFTQSRLVKNAIDGATTKLLAHAGFQLSGGMSWAYSFTDSVLPQDSSATGRIEEERSGCGMWDLQGIVDADIHTNYGSVNSGFYTWRDVDYRFEDTQSPWRIESANGTYANCRVMRMACSDFSGRRPDPARTGWLQVKFLNDWFRACNALAGKTIMQWAYPEDVEP